jgi:hypothetical protein
LNCAAGIGKIGTIRVDRNGSGGGEGRLGTGSHKRIATALIGAALLTAAGFYYVQKKLRPQVRTVEGTIVQLDAETRHGVIEIRHPRTGQHITIRGEVPADCEIRIDGHTARLSDLKAGERVRVQGTITLNGRITARWIHAHRTMPPAGRPPGLPETPPAGAHAEASAPASSPAQPLR